MPREGRYPSLPILYTKGSHFDVGYMTGTTFADRIRRYWHDDENLSQPSRALYESRDGRELCDVLQKKGEDNFPQYAAEIRGLAAGVGVSYEEMFFQNSILDMMYMDEGVVLDLLGKTVPLTRLLERCSTVLLNRPDVKVIGHNEDDYTALQQYGYMVSAVVDDPDFPSMLQGQGTNGYDNNKEECYPGMLPGVAFSFNDHGLVFCINSQTTDTVYCGAPNACITRSLLGAASVEQCRHLLENRRRGGGNLGFSVNIADVKSPDVLWSAEVQPGLLGNKVHMHPVVEAAFGDMEDKGCYFQTNTYQHLSISNKLYSHLQRPLARSSRAKEMFPCADEHDVLRVLGDTEIYNDFVIFRRPTSKDKLTTCTTALFDIKGKRLDVYVDNPKSSLPLMSLPIHVTQ
ncbi:hypothetical protein C0Q70_08279 [Pomacea canaliculata]|uniref:Peptidase C45 hydrolase domain-containing protein n=1 Tax=Pomacea canaliculata TaxID=400727 RepID=A0A2T7PHE5_POMCA|nr:hypothetical protein C0Q70_08279 [Pomacea canaliculata]